ncbi:MAG: cation:proton antiporter [Myxococcaceae bacterium]|nr:cation:proton antiporter [Myxococcaceae bacterium]
MTLTRPVTDRLAEFLSTAAQAADALPGEPALPADAPAVAQQAVAAASEAAASALAQAAAAPTLTVSLFLVLVAAIFLIGGLGEIVFEKTGVPDVVWLILVGIFVGPVSGLASREVLSQVAPYFGALTLIIVLFNGGSELRLGDLKQAAPRALLLAILTFVFSAAALALLSMGAKQLGWLPREWTWMHGVCLGAILGGSSSIVVMPALRKARLNAELTNLTNLESALTDSFCVVAVGASIQIMLTGSSDAGAAATALGKSFGIGIALGAVAGILALLCLRRLSKSEHAYPLTLGALIILYVIVDELEGSAALAILTTAIILGNARFFSRRIGLAEDAYLDRGIKDVHGQLTFFIKSIFFTFIGAMLGAPWGLVLVGVVFGLTLLVVRVPAVFLATMRSTLDMDSRKIAAVFLPRGMAAGVLAMMPHSMGVPGTERLPVLVFAAIVTTIVLFATGFPLLKWHLARAHRRQEEATGRAIAISDGATCSTQGVADEAAAVGAQVGVVEANDAADAAKESGATVPETLADTGSPTGEARTEDRADDVVDEQAREALP